PGRLVGIVSFYYGSVRFFLDFLRADEIGRGVSVTDLRYFGLTTAQYISLAIFAAGVWLLFIRRPKASDMDYARPGEASQLCTSSPPGEASQASEAAGPNPTAQD